MARAMDLTTHLSDQHLAERFGAATLGRAAPYASGAITAWEWEEIHDGSLIVYADVQGTAFHPYEVTLVVDSRHGVMASECDCPVGHRCKHGAAVALMLRRHFGQINAHPGHTWRQQFAALTRELASRDQVVEQQPVALQFSLERPRYGYADGPQLGLRPMRPGAKQPWIKTGADWTQVPRLVAERRAAPAQAGALDALHFALTRHGFAAIAGETPTLARFGPELPQLLRDAAAAGVTFLGVDPITAVRLSKAPAAPIADLTSDGEETVVAVGLDVDGETWSGEGLHLFGTDARVAAHLSAAGELTIAEVVPPPTRTLVQLARHEPIRVPSADREELTDRLGALVRHLELRSSDETVAIPDPIRPTLALTVLWRSGTEAELGWRWRYGDAECPAGSDDPLDGMRDRAAELAVVQQLPAGLLGRRRLLDGDALEFALHTVAHLRELPDVEVVEEQRPHFREASEAPEVSFELAEPPEEHTDWLDLEVHVHVDGEPIPLPDVIDALTREAPYLILRSGLYVTTDRPEFDRLRDAVAAAADLRERDGERISVGKHDLGTWAQLADSGIVDAQAAEWVARARALRDLVDIPRPTPTGLASTLRPYQLEGFWWLCFLREHGLGGILADDMGLGKTLQVLAAIQHAVTEHGPGRPYLVVAPTSVVTAWQHEAARHAPGLRLGVIARRSDDVAAIAAESDVVVTTYTLLRLEEERYSALAWDGLVLDEAHHLKNHQSKTYAAVRKVPAPFRLAVTGTPFENRLMELWSLLSIAVPGLYPSPQQFRDSVVKPVEKGGDASALRRLQARIKPFLLRRTKEYVADDLPPKQEQVLDVQLNRRHRQLYDSHLAKERQRILGLVDDFESNRVAIFAALTKLRQLALDPALVDDAHDAVGSAKIDVLLDHLGELAAEGHQALVFSQFTSYLRRVEAQLQAAGVATTYLDGSTRDRAAVIDRFRDGEATVFLISLKAGGTGLTLTEASYVFVLDPWWNPAAEAQAVDRAHRIGQQRHVNVYRLVAGDTIEEKVMELKERKAKLFSRVIDTEGALGEAITAEDIRAIVTD